MANPIDIPALKPHQIERFWKYVLKKGPDECWPYIGGRYGNGYGAFSINDRVYHAHRVAYLLSHGQLNKDELVCHHCDNPPCCNPKHLFTGSHDDNQKDRKSKNRHGFGINNGRAKLDDAKVIEIRRRYQRGTPGRKCANSGGALAKEFGVSDVTILSIINRLNWTHI